MKTIAKILSLLMVISVLACSSLTVSAESDLTPDPNAPANTKYSDLWVSAGSSVTTTVSSTTTATRYTCYMRLRWFQFSYLPACYMPPNKRVNTRLYYGSNKASDVAHFTGTTPRGSYNYYYWDGYGGNGTSYKLTINSNVTPNTLEAYVDWSANPYF